MGKQRFNLVLDAYELEWVRFRAMMGEKSATEAIRDMIVNDLTEADEDTRQAFEAAIRAKRAQEEG